MKKKIILILFIIFITSFSYFIGYSNAFKKEVLEDNNTNTNILTNNALTMMLETEAGSGEYALSNSGEWPGDGYIFNSELSRCENGGELSWNSETNRVVMQSNKSDRCYVYFDIYNAPTIESVITSYTANNIIVDVNATPGDGNIVSYHYSINDGEYITNSISSYTFSNLQTYVEYNIKVYVTDSNGITSSIYNTSEMIELNLISFTFTDHISNETKTYYAEEEMTWTDFVNSEYNDGNFSIYCSSNLLYNGRLTSIYMPSNVLVTSGSYITQSGQPEPCSDSGIL